MADKYPTCPLHCLIEPCIICKPPHVSEAVCGDVAQDDAVVRCECGKLRSAVREHGYTRPAPLSSSGRWGMHF